MKNILIILSILGTHSLYAQEFNVLSFNIRYNNPNDGINAWPNRVEMVTGLMRFYDADIIGVQEADHQMVAQIENTLPKLKGFGTGRDDGSPVGDYGATIFYNCKKFTIVKKGTFWLSETPEKPGISWNAAFNRICNWGIFKFKKSNRKFVVLNTHFDHISPLARENSSIVLINKIKEINPKNLPLVLTGDFNTTPETKPIENIKTILFDSKEKSREPPYGPIGTYNAFKFHELFNMRVDYIFVNSAMEVLKFGTLSDSKDLRYPSDHLPVFAKIKLK